MKPIIGSGLHRAYGTRFQRAGEPFPGTPWESQPNWNILRDAMIVVATLLLVWAATCLAFSLEAVK